MARRRQDARADDEQPAGLGIEPKEKRSDPPRFFDIPREDAFPLLGRNLLVMRGHLLWMQCFFKWFCFPTDAFKGVPYPEEDFTILDKTLLWFFDGFKRWDALHFLHIAENGYTWDRNLAFFPLFPILIRALSRCWAWPLMSFHLLHKSTAYLLSALLLNLFAFLMAGWILYHITLRITNSVKQSVIAVLIFSLNPASIFFTAAYSESIYGAMTFGGIWMMMKSRGKFGIEYVLACGLFALSFATRSNGLLNFGYVCWYVIVDLLHKRGNDGRFHSLLTLSKVRMFFEVCSSLLKLLIALAIIILPMKHHAQIQHERFCSQAAPPLSARLNSYATEHDLVVAGRTGIEWCNQNSLIFPPWYSVIQDKYWDVGFLKYWQWRKLPFFLMASPALFVWILGLKLTATGLLDYSNFNAFLIDADGLFPYGVHSSVMAFGAIFFYNVEVFTRIFFSCSPFPYLILAKWISEKTPMVVLSDLFEPACLPFFGNLIRRGDTSSLICIYMLLYFTTGSMLHISWFPFT